MVNRSHHRIAGSLILVVSLVGLVGCGVGDRLGNKLDRSSKSEDAAAVQAEKGSFDLVQPGIEGFAPDYFQFLDLSLTSEIGKRAYQKRVPYAAGELVKWGGIEAGRYELSIGLIRDGVVLMKGTAKGVAIKSSETAKVEVTLEPTSTTGNLHVIIRTKDSPVNNYACYLASQPIPELCEMNARHRCEFSYDPPAISSPNSCMPASRVIAAEGECGLVSVRHELYQKICQAGIAFSKKDLDAIVCSKTVAPKPEPLPPMPSIK